MTEDRVRVLRVLEYEGPRSWVEATLAQNAVKGEKRFAKGDELHIIREAIVGEAPVIVRQGADALSHNLGDAEAAYYQPRNPAPALIPRVYHYAGCPENSNNGLGSCDCDERAS